MPSGAKKRKAAKKKKEKEANINASKNNLQGNDEFKSQDEKGSDGDEASSPAYHDHDNHRHPFNEGDEEIEEKDPSDAQPSVDVNSMEEVTTDIKSCETVVGDGDGVVNIEQELKSEESSDSKNISVQHIDTTKLSSYGDKNSNGISNDVSLNEKNSKDPSINASQEAITNADLVKPVNSSPAETTMIAQNAPAKDIDDSVDSYSIVNSLTAVTSVSEVKRSDAESALIENSAAPAAAATYFAMKKNEDTVYPLSEENVRTSILEEPKPKEHNSKVAVSLSSSPLVVKDSETRECFGNQPLVPSAPHIVQKTSLLSCCGLFEVLSGSK